MLKNVIDTKDHKPYGDYKQLISRKISKCIYFSSISLHSPRNELMLIY